MSEQANRIASIIANDGTMTIILDGVAYTINRDYPTYTEVKVALVKEDADRLSQLLDVPKAVSSYSDGKIQVRDGIVSYNGEALHNVLTERILASMREGFPFKGMLNFLNNLMKNPSARAVEELYKFLENKGLPITPDGCFIGYKGVESNFLDRYSKSIDNSPGQVVKMERNKVDDNCTRTCSKGLHVGAFDYAKNYGNVVVLVKVNPKDCVSVPDEAGARKLRVCEYEVVGVYKGEDVIGTSMFVPTREEKDDELEDEDDFLDYELEDDDSFEDSLEIDLSDLED